MDIDRAFDDLQEVADADPEQVAAALERRDLFENALGSEDDVVQIVPSGSLARRTQRDPINDVDMLVVFDADEHPEWGEHGSSAEEALKHLRGRVKDLLGVTEGSVAKDVRRADVRNHAVKCFLDDPDDPDAFTVDVTPALRQPGGALLIPERKNATWIDTDPEHLIGEVERRNSDWNEFRPMVRVLKMWGKERGADLKSLTMEVLALNHLPAEVSRATALQRFFSAAELAIDQPIEDPAGLCGEIQPDLDIETARDQLNDAASNAWQAVDAAAAGDTERACCLWRKVFGDAFPEPDGGCEDGGEGGAGAAFNIGLGAGAIGIDEPRPVIDAPQG